MKKLFDWDRFKNESNSVVVHCKTIEEAVDFCKQLDKRGFKWSTGERYAISNCYFKYKNETCYTNHGTYGNLEFYTTNNYIILEWSDYMVKEFTKADLKTGMIVTTRNGYEFCVFRNIDMGCSKNYDCIVNNAMYIELENYNENLTRNDDIYLYDIIKIESASSPLCFMDIRYEKNKRTLLWECEKVKEMTMAELEEHFGCKIKIVKED